MLRTKRYRLIPDATRRVGYPLVHRYKSVTVWRKSELNSALEGIPNLVLSHSIITTAVEKLTETQLFYVEIGQELLHSVLITSENDFITPLKKDTDEEQ